MQIPDQTQHWMDYLGAGGWLVLPLLLVSFGIWYGYLLTLVRLHVDLRRRRVEALDLPAEREGMQAAVARLAGMSGAVPRMICGVVARVRAGLSLREACRQCREAESGRYSGVMVVLRALVIAAPLLGLLGTVLGMIETFEGVASRSGDAADMVASGISRALITTQIGLVAALPGTFGVAHLHRLQVRLRNALDRCELQLLSLYEHGSGGTRGEGAA